MRNDSLRALTPFLCLALQTLLTSQIEAQRFPPPEPQYKVEVKRSVMVPMRDGVRLSTDLYFPKGAGEKLPIILIRTPYSKKGIRDRSGAGPYFFAGQGYVVAVQDVRGKFESEGKFMVVANEGRDGYDTVSWLARRPFSTGKIGTFGCSYLGESQMYLARLEHPNHVAMIPHAAGDAYWKRAWLRYGGALELAPAFGWFRDSGSKVSLQPPPGAPDNFYARMGKYFNPAPVMPQVDYEKIWATLPTVDLQKIAGSLPSDWEDLVSRPNPHDPWYDQFGFVRESDSFTTPALHINSWYDYGVGRTLKMFNIMRGNSKGSPQGDNQFVIVSPTTHCGSDRTPQPTVVGTRNLGDTSLDYWGLYVRWFDYWLKGIENGVTQTTPKVQIYVMGRNEWRSESEWPPSRARLRNFYLRSDGHANSRFGTGYLSPERPSSEEPDRFTYDPATPVPSLGGPLCCTGAPNAPAGAFDQSEREIRQDVLVYSSPVLKSGVEVTGPVEVVLYVSSSARDTDFTAKLLDVYPDGTAYNVQEGILRARYRKGYEREVWMEPDGIYEVRVSLDVTSNYFGPGHQVRLEVSSSNFPRFDRNLNTGGRNYDETEWVVAKNTVHHSTEYPSHIVLPVMP